MIRRNWCGQLGPNSAERSDRSGLRWGDTDHTRIVTGNKTLEFLEYISKIPYQRSFLAICHWLTIFPNKNDIRKMCYIIWDNWNNSKIMRFYLIWLTETNAIARQTSTTAVTLLEQSQKQSRKKQIAIPNDAKNLAFNNILSFFFLFTESSSIQSLWISNRFSLIIQGSRTKLVLRRNQNILIPKSIISSIHMFCPARLIFRYF